MISRLYSPLLILAMLASCRTEETQPKIIKLETGRYEIRYEGGDSIKAIGRTVCPHGHVHSDLGQRSDGSGASVWVAVVRCTDDAK